MKLATRKINPVVSGRVVTALPFGDAQGNPASVVFTGAAANRMEFASCPCSTAQRRRGACRCTPDAGALCQGRVKICWTRAHVCTSPGADGAAAAVPGDAHRSRVNVSAHLPKPYHGAAGAWLVTHSLGPYPLTHATRNTVIAKDGASVSLMPLLRAVDASRKAAATTVRLSFNATVAATGLSCLGFVDICSRPLLVSSRARNAPGCTTFEATRAMRDLTVCSG